MAENQHCEEPGNKGLKTNILGSGIPLEMAVYSVLASLDADWIEPGYVFTTLDENGAVKQRSLDFVVSIPRSRDPLDLNGIQLYLLIECKYSDPKERVWLFMPDAFPKQDTIFDAWRPSLWQDRTPLTPMSPEEIEKIVSGEGARNPRSGGPRCVRGTVLGQKEGNRIPTLTSATHQLRDCLHHLAIDRFRLFTKQWSKPAALVFVPIVITNSELRILKPDVYGELAAHPDSSQKLADITSISRRVLVRCPGGLDHVDWNWQRFWDTHHAYDMSRVEKGLPFYKRERTLEHHIRRFFATVPAYITVIHFDEISNLLEEVISWVKSLEFR